MNDPTTPVNSGGEMNKLWAIGDIHGERKLLEGLLKKIPENDKLVFMGDMIDRGPDSEGVVELVRWHVKNKGAIALLGNHEIFALTPSKHDVWMYEGNGGKATLDSYGGTVPGDVLDWFRILPVEATIDDIYLCHAPFSEEKRPLQKTFNYIEQSEERYATSPMPFAVCGHIHRLREGLLSPRIYSSYAFIDTGAGCADWAPLTAFEVHTKQIIQEWP